ncbi:MAG: hypothetical protein NXH82_04455 [Rhodobacteraceae bacterium]|nr:hypothetical protein [Paracoccaceae bacterium]
MSEQADDTTQTVPQANAAQRRLAMAKAKVGRARAEAMRKKIEMEAARRRVQNP